MTWLLVLLGGAAGSGARYGLGLLAGPRAFPWTTLGINVVGSFVIGVVLTFATAGRLEPRLSTGLAVGLLGGFTTFSAFSWETLTLLQQGHVLRAGAYVAGSVAVGLAAVYAGHRLGTWIIG